MKKILKHGFTLIELLIVIAIVAILTALVTTNLQSARSRARDVRRKSDLRSIEQSIRLYYNDTTSFPTSGTSYEINGCEGESSCSWGGPFANASTIYMSSLPFDPSSSDTNTITYQYYSDSDDRFMLVAKLENLSDPDIQTSQAGCATLYGSIPDTPTQDYVICAQ